MASSFGLWVTLVGQPHGPKEAPLFQAGRARARGPGTTCSATAFRDASHRAKRGFVQRVSEFSGTQKGPLLNYFQIRRL